MTTYRRREPEKYIAVQFAGEQLEEFPEMYFRKIGENLWKICLYDNWLNVGRGDWIVWAEGYLDVFFPQEFERVFEEVKE